MKKQKRYHDKSWEQKFTAVFTCYEWEEMNPMMIEFTALPEANEKDRVKLAKIALAEVIYYPMLEEKDCTPEKLLDELEADCCEIILQGIFAGVSLIKKSISF